ncbi:MAG: hypothetical protein NC914_03580 [Candidatus Omnitrophica bacterium]|nr:hypothetical protein [Candidatus Omnitrophota bacterium]
MVEDFLYRPPSDPQVEVELFWFQANNLIKLMAMVSIVFASFIVIVAKEFLK